MERWFSPIDRSLRRDLKSEFGSLFWFDAISYKEVIDLRSASPLDHKSIIDSVTKTKRLAIADPAWKSVGLASEIITFVYESLGSEMKSNPIRICLPDSHTPVASSLESNYYPNEEVFISSINKLINN